jgi:hypothetical protein
MSNSTAVLEKLRRFKASRPQGYSGGKTKGVFHTWKTGDNRTRLVGSFLEMRGHFIAPAPKRNDRGLCRADAFQGENSLQQTINCLDWDVTKEEVRKPFCCPICRLAELSRQLLKDQTLSKEEKEFFLALRNAASQRQSLKWNIIDRDDPFIVLVDESGEEKRVKGYKIANVGMEVYKDIDGIFDQCGFDISDPTGGIDIVVKRSEAGGRTTYSAQAVLENMMVKVTPLTREELAMPMHDIKVRSGKMMTVQAIMDGLHEDLRQLLEVNSQDATPEPDQEEAPQEEPAAEISAPAETEEAAAIDSVLGEGAEEDNLNMEPQAAQAAQAEPTPEPEPPPVQPQPVARVAKPAPVRQVLPPVKQVAAPVKAVAAPVKAVAASAKPAVTKPMTAPARAVTAPARTVAGIVRKPIVPPATQKKT